MKSSAVARIARLESRDTPPDALVIVRRIIGPAGKTVPVDSFQDRDGRSWRRSIGENDEEFETRVIDEARQGANGRVVSLRPTLGANANEQT